MGCLWLFTLDCGAGRQPLSMPGCPGLGTRAELQTGCIREAMKLWQAPWMGALGKEGVLGQHHLVPGSGTVVA